MDAIKYADNMNSSILQHPENSHQEVNGQDSSANLKLETLDLSKKKLQCLSEDLYRNNPCIKSLHLEGNALCSLPDDLFLHLPLLVWLDLRNNEITSLPGTIGRHRHLQYLLLEGNPIKALPIELEFPAIEKLNLKELKSSMDLSSDWSNNEEMERFEMLKHKIEEMVQNEPLNCYRKPQNMREPVKGTGWKFLTESRHAMLVERRKSASDRRAEEKARLANFIQKQRNQDVLKDWQKQTKLIQDQKAKSKRTENHHQVPTTAPPFAIDLDTSQHKNSWDKQKSLPAEKQEMMPRVTSVKEMEKARASRDLRLEHRIKQHIQTMQERKKNPKCSAQEEMEAARKELEVASLLQAELLQRKREQDVALEYRFTAFTGDVSPGDIPGGGPQNIFATTM
ncbi:leucine-rich repeat-containing protein 27 isoform 2-T3 [Anomaloglossus baeobatrachus]|uniref:leucine-rich repeat-containing protein 27 isoform X2 n=1 Tax=Anomaloglossus baeobatrachus TaxID=238106 RepID=UPI003F5026D8